MSDSDNIPIGDPGWSYESECKLAKALVQAYSTIDEAMPRRPRRGSISEALQAISRAYAESIHLRVKHVSTVSMPDENGVVKQDAER